jgi:hypothetical protein
MGARILRFDSGPRRSYGSGIHKETGSGGRAAGSAANVQITTGHLGWLTINRFERFMVFRPPALPEVYDYLCSCSKAILLCIYDPNLSERDTQYRKIQKRILAKCCKL